MIEQFVRLCPTLVDFNSVNNLLCSKAVSCTPNNPRSSVSLISFLSYVVLISSHLSVFRYF